MKISHLISSLEEANQRNLPSKYDSLANQSSLQDRKAARQPDIDARLAAKNAAPVAQPGTALATTNNNPDLEKLEKAKQDALANNPQLAKDVQDSDASVQNSQQRANDVSTYQQKQASEKDMGQADVVDVDPKDVKDVSNQPQLEKPAVAPTTPDQAPPDAGLGQHSDGTYIQQGDQFDPETGKPVATPQATAGSETPPPAATDPTQAPAQQKQTFGGALKQLGSKAVKGATNAVGNAIKAAPAAISGAAGSAVGGFAGGLKRGYQSQSGGGGSMGGGSAGGGNNMQALNARLANIEKRLGVTAEGKLQFESKFLGKKI